LTRFDKLNIKIPQAELTNLIKEKIISFYKQPNQLNDIIRQVHIVIDFIIATGCDKSVKISDYAVNTLKMTNFQNNYNISVNKQVNSTFLFYFVVEFYSILFKLKVE
jgi:hypothetical protein